MAVKTKKSKFRLAFIILSAILIALVAVFAGLYIYAGKLDEQRVIIPDSPFSVCTSCDGEQIVVKSWKNRKDNKYYAFLPGSADLGSISFHCDGATKLIVDSQHAALDEPCPLINQIGEYKIKLDSKSYDLVVLQGSQIPSLHIDTQTGSLDSVYADKDHKENGDIRVYDKGSLVLDESLKYIKGRGNVSWDWPQKSFNIKFKHKTSLLGLGEAKKYSIITTFVDPTLIKDSLTFDISQKLGLEYTSEFRQIDLYVNGNYLGNYILVESVGVGKNRVDINDLDDANELANPGVDFDELEVLTTTNEDEHDLSGTCKWVDIPNDPENIKDGYIIQLELDNRYKNEKSGFVTNIGQSVVLKSPEYATKSEVLYISNLYQQFEDAVISQDGYNEQGKYYLDYIDLESFVKMYLVQEFAKNRDANDTSTYMYLDSDGIIKAGPVWDFDNGYGNQVFLGNMNDLSNVKPDELLVCASGFFSQLMSHQDFRDEVYRIWSDEMRQLAIDELDFITAEGEKISQSATDNAIRWNRFNSTNTAQNEESYKNAINELTNFVKTRIDFFDNTFCEGSVFVKYDSNGAWISKKQCSLTSSSSEVAALENKCTSDKKFLGWNTQPDGSGTAYNVGDKITPDSDSVTLYAQWGEESKKLKLENKLSQYVTKIKNSLTYRYKTLVG